MGQKVNPNVFRVGNKLPNKWQISYYSNNKNYTTVVGNNILLRKAIMANYQAAQVSKISSEFSNAKIVLNIYCRKPGVLVGSGGTGIETLKQKVKQIACVDVVGINVHEVKYPDLEPTLVAKSVASQIQKRVSFRKATKRAIQSTMKQGAQGVKILCSGRLGGAEIARSEKYMQGKIPLHTLRADIQYAQENAHTAYGVIGIKVWIYRDDKLIHSPKKGKNQTNKK